MKVRVNAELCAEQGCDVLVQPQYVHEKRKSGKHVLTVTGFPAYYKNFRTATSADLEALKAADPNIALVSEQYGDQLEQYRQNMQNEMKVKTQKKERKQQKEKTPLGDRIKGLFRF